MINSSVFNYQNINNLPQNNNLQGNFNIGYFLDEKQTIGFDYSQENFGREFNFFKNDKIYYQIQNPNLIFFGVFYRYEFNNISIINEKLHPFGQANYGFASSAQLAKLSSGLIYDLPFCKLTAGFNYNFIFSNVQNQLILSNKFGAFIGVGLFY